MTVFANGLEVSAQAQNVKVIAAFPDVCFTPPLTPATPPGVPIPYPNFGMDADLASGSGTVKIGGKPVSQENASHYSKISGDEAGSAPKKSVITSKNMGKAYAQMWSMDVKVEGKGVVRFSDIMTTNHALNVGSSPPMPAVATATPPPVGQAGAAKVKCPPIGPYNKIKCKKGSHAHHIVPDMCYRTKGRGAASGRMLGAPSLGGGACICLTHKQHSNLHSDLNADLAALGTSPRAASGLPKGAKTVTGTAPMKEIMKPVRKSVNSIPGLHPECKKKAIAAAARQVRPVRNKPGRTTTALPNANAMRVIRRGYY